MPSKMDPKPSGDGGSSSKTEQATRKPDTKPSGDGCSSDSKQQATSKREGEIPKQRGESSGSKTLILEGLGEKARVEEFLHRFEAKSNELHKYFENRDE